MRGRVNAARLLYRHMGHSLCPHAHRTSGRAGISYIGEIRWPRALKQQSASLNSGFEWRMDDTWMMVLTKLRVHYGLPIATILEGHHMGTDHTAWRRPHCPHVMTTTISVNSRAKASIMVEENARDACQLGATGPRRLG